MPHQCKPSVCWCVFKPKIALRSRNHLFSGSRAWYCRCDTPEPKHWFAGAGQGGTRAERSFGSSYFMEVKKRLPHPFLSLHRRLTFSPRLVSRAQLECNPMGRSPCNPPWLGGRARPAVPPGSSAWRVPRCHQNPCGGAWGGQAWTNVSPSSFTLSGISQTRSRPNCWLRDGHRCLVLLVTGKISIIHTWEGTLLASAVQTQ